MTFSSDLSGMALFVKIVDSGSLSAAGRLLGVPKATISRQLLMIEHRLGAPLLLRSTRALSLTDAGRRYYERVRPIVRDAERAQAESLAETATPSGTLRIAASTAYGSHVLTPKLFSFQRLYPDVRLDLNLSDKRVNLVAEGFDLVIRMGALDDSELISSRLDHVEMLMVAAPQYIADNGMPRDVNDLHNHKIILTRKELVHWNIDGQSVRVSWHLSTSNMIVTRDAVCAGLGIAILPYFLAAQPIADGMMVRVLPNSQLDTVEVTALHAASVAPAVAVRKLISHLKDVGVRDGTMRS
jgi:DNA-binding transcriptional LysR family regulator